MISGPLALLALASLIRLSGCEMIRIQQGRQMFFMIVVNLALYALSEPAAVMEMAYPKSCSMLRPKGCMTGSECIACLLSFSHFVSLSPSICSWWYPSVLNEYFTTWSFCLVLSDDEMINIKSTVAGSSSENDVTEDSAIL
jgi:hypothetical protein